MWSSYFLTMKHLFVISLLHPGTLHFSFLNIYTHIYTHIYYFWSWVFQQLHFSNLWVSFLFPCIIYVSFMFVCQPFIEITALSCKNLNFMQNFGDQIVLYQFFYDFLELCMSDCVYIWIFDLNDSYDQDLSV